MEAITREEKLMSGQQLEPITRKELFLAKAAGMDVQTPEPITREEMFLSQISGGGSSPVVEPLTVTENGTYEAPEGVDGYSPVTVNVASSGGSEMEEQFIRAIERDESKPGTELPEGLTRIGDNAFYKNTAITFTSLPDGVTSIGKNAFSGCKKLALTYLPDGVTTIELGAFSECAAMPLTYMPANLKTADMNAFYGCLAITNITFKGKPDTIQKSAFNGCANLLTINVPWAEGEVANAPWGATNATINYNYTGG